MSFSTSGSPTPTPTTGRPEQGKFTTIQKDFLNQHPPAYFAIKDNKKGTKKDWVLSNVYPLYVKEFNSDGPSGVNLASLETVYHFIDLTRPVNTNRNIVRRKSRIIFSTRSHRRLLNHRPNQVKPFVPPTPKSFLRRQIKTSFQRL